MPDVALILFIALLKYVSALSDWVYQELRTVNKFYFQQAFATVLCCKRPLMLWDCFTCMQEGMCAARRSR